MSSPSGYAYGEMADWLWETRPFITCMRDSRLRGYGTSSIRRATLDRTAEGGCPHVACCSYYLSTHESLQGSVIFYDCDTGSYDALLRTTPHL
jgi:hypothetical protein